MAKTNVRARNGHTKLKIERENGTLLSLRISQAVYDARGSGHSGIKHSLLLYEENKSAPVGYLVYGKGNGKSGYGWVFQTDLEQTIQIGVPKLSAEKFFRNLHQQGGIVGDDWSEIEGDIVR